MRTELRNSFVVLLVMTLVTGVCYPFLVTIVALVAFPHQANGSLITKNGVVVGSELIGQHFSRPEYFWGRLSATAPLPYNSAASSGSNLGPKNPELLKAAQHRAEQLMSYDSSSKRIPIDLLTASASGLDPHISPAAAEFQVLRVAKLRGISVERVRDLVLKATEGRQLGILGEPRVNVLQLNLSLDTLATASRETGLK